MNLKHAQYIMEIIKEGSITNASKAMHVSQPALSQTIKAVEKYLGAPIFLRNTKPIVLTEAGKKYITAVKKIITISTNLLHEVADIQYEGYGTLRLGIPIQRAMQMLPEVMPIFRQRYPHIKLEIQEAGSNITEKAVLNGAVDIAVLTTTPSNDELTYDLVETEDVVLVANKLTMLAQRIEPGTPIHVTEAKNESFISITEGHNVRRVQDTLFDVYEMKPSIILETSSIEVGKRLVDSMEAVFICPDVYLDEYFMSRNHCAIYPLLGIANKRYCYVCSRKDAYLSPYARAFVELIKSHGKNERVSKDHEEN
ncbi:MAG: LysR family transcriptional regulator [Acidaminococcus sp.]|jgi:DNA-binding transcriptional LysR family regulator|nr:LysR family transcriptional regulator [Acidaminococcus sp.]MCI2100669.1 LysR family transcriptional regulator [Acidaminococcus sp.]MCI2114990.1 LysR family transcriptional regulator [Acidaminococcus sp.]MCI2117433.1 LysR family transcriptional regulator [Acidaminococcus sp.]